MAVIELHVWCDLCSICSMPSWSLRNSHPCRGERRMHSVMQVVQRRQHQAAAALCCCHELALLVCRLHGLRGLLHESLARIH